MAGCATTENYEKMLNSWMGATEDALDLAARPIAAFTAIVVLVLALPTFAETKRDPHQRVLFMKKHPCPATGKTRGACPGYVVDHVKPLCAGGVDHPSNMQWQTIPEGKKKDRLEAEECRAYRRRN